MPDSTVPPLAIITGERGQREIVRPLAAVGQPCAVLDWEMLRQESSWPHLRFLGAVWRLIRTPPGAAVLTDMNSAFLAAILLAAKLHGRRVVLRLRGDPFAETRGQVRFHWQQREWPQLARVIVAWLLDRPLFSAVDFFLPVSEWIVRRLDIGARSAVVRIPVLLEHFPARPVRSLGPDEPLRLLAVTNFNYPQKVAALGRFLADYGPFLRAQRIHVVVAGAGIAWQSFAAAHGGQAEMLGFVQNVAGLYADCDVFVHFSDLDAFPYVVLEAQASGLPVLVNRDCGMLEQVEDGRTGLIVDLEQRDQLEKQLIALRDQPSLRQRLGENARQHVAEQYSLTAIGRGLLPYCDTASRS